MVRSPRAVSVLLVSALGPGLALLAGPASADSIQTETATLPSARGYTAAVWAGSVAYVIGGYNGAGIAEIVRFDPAMNTAVSVKPLASGLYGASAIWDGTNVYIFGGFTTDYVTTILKYTPSTGALVSAGNLPSARYATAAFWDGTYAYVIGGYGPPGGYLTSVVRYDPATQGTQSMASLPSARGAASVVWDGSAAYIFGGAPTYPSQVLRFDPAANTIAPAGDLPYGVSAAGAVYAGGAAYVFGGHGPASVATIARYDPATATSTTRATTMPTTRTHTSAAWSGTRAYVFGGEVPSGFTDTILSYGPAVVPGAPWSFDAYPGPGGGEITLQWNAPVDDGGAPITQYRVYRGSTADTTTFLADAGPQLSFRDSGLPPGSTWFYRVSAVNVAGEGPSTGVESATTYTPPSAPRDLRALPAPPTIDEVFVGWRAPASDGGTAVTGYRIYRGYDAGEKAFVAEVPADETSYFDTTCDPPLGGSCTYVVTAVNGAGEGPPSNEASAPGPITADDASGPVVVPEQSLSHAVPALATPAVPSFGVTSQPVVLPPACTDPACQDGVAVPPVVVPGTDETCTPADLVCVDPIPGQTLDPGASVDGPCTIRPEPCAAHLLLDGQEVETGPVAPVPLTPEIEARFDLGPGNVDPHLGETETVGPIRVPPVTLCASGCPVPVLPDGEAHANVTVKVGDDEVGAPVDIVLP